MLILQDGVFLRLENPTSTNFRIGNDTLQKESTQDISFDFFDRDRLRFMVNQGVEFKGFVLEGEEDTLYEISEASDETSELKKEVERLEKELEEAQAEAEKIAETEEETEEETLEEGEDETRDYEDQTVKDLRDELRSRNLKVSGNKDELIERLREDDAS